MHQDPWHEMRDMEHGYGSHYKEEHFYDNPKDHGGLHEAHVDPMAVAYAGVIPFYEDEEPLTDTEEYYYGAPLHQYHHDYHHTDVVHSCWKKAYGRTAGEPMSTCPADHEKDGALCYPHC